MELTSVDARALLKEQGLKATGPRVAVLTALATSGHPISYTEMLVRLGDRGAELDPATAFRNLKRLTEAGLARVVSHAGGQARYELGRGKAGPEHVHPHFLCTDCGTVSCLPVAALPRPQATGRWQEAVSRALLQLQGSCPDCLVAPA